VGSNPAAAQTHNRRCVVGISLLLLATGQALLFGDVQTYGTHYGKTRKAAALSEEVKALQEAGVAAQAEYERVRDRNLEVRL
jgi:hypothetical protein